MAYDPVLLLALIGLLSILALPINAFWYSFFILALRRLGRLDFAPPGAPRARLLRRRVAIAVVIITLVSCAANVLWSWQECYWFVETQEPLLKMLVLLAASVVPMSMAIVRLEVIPSALIAAGMVVVTIAQSLVVVSVFYSEWPYAHDNPTPWVIAYGAVCAILSIFLLRAIGRVGSVPDGTEGSQKQVETEAS